jgi:hypothetical protein
VLELRSLFTLQEWANLRAQGIKTPEIAAWQRMPVEGMGFSAANKAKAIYPYVLNVYNDPRFSQVIGNRFHQNPMWSCLDAGYTLR